MATKKTAAIDTPSIEEVADVDSHAAKSVATNSTITLDLADAERIYELYRNVELADAHFHTCQSLNFRQHVHDVYNAANNKNAYEKLKGSIDSAKGER